MAFSPAIILPSFEATIEATKSFLGENDFLFFFFFSQAREIAMVVDISCPPDGHIRPLKTEADRNSLGQKIGGPETSDGSTPKKTT